MNEHELITSPAEQPQNQEDQNRRNLITLGICFVLAILSIVILGGIFSNPDSYGNLIASLNEKKTNVQTLMGSAVTASAALTLMPGDFGTPIAEELASMSTYFIVILCALYIEKFLVSITGPVVFNFIFPVGLILFGLGAYLPRFPLRKAAAKIVMLGTIMALLVPISLGISGLVEKQYEVEIQQTIQDATSSADQIQGVADEADSDNTDIWSQFINRVKGGSATLMNEMKQMLGNFTDVVAVYIVTSCIIPLAVLLIGVWLIRNLFGMSVNLPNLPTLGKKGRHL